MRKYMSTESNPDVIPIDGTYQKIQTSYSLTSNISELFNLNQENPEPTNETQRVADLSLFFIILTWSGISCLFNFAADWLLTATWFAIIIVSICCNFTTNSLSTPLSYGGNCITNANICLEIASRVKTRRGVSGPRMDILCEPDVWGNKRLFGPAVFSWACCESL